MKGEEENEEEEEEEEEEEGGGEEEEEEEDFGKWRSHFGASDYFVLNMKKLQFTETSKTKCLSKFIDKTSIKSNILLRRPLKENSNEDTAASADRNILF